jgi:hypothetical protein
LLEKPIHQSYLKSRLD